MKTAKEIKELREEHCKNVQSEARTAALQWIAERAADIENTLVLGEKTYYDLYYEGKVDDPLSNATRQWIAAELGALGYTVLFYDETTIGHKKQLYRVRIEL